MSHLPPSALAAREPAPERFSGWAMWIAAALPFVLYLKTLSGESYWLDSGEFVEASVELDIAHPPGHPLTAVYGKFWSLLPLGSLAFRVALGQAVASALGAALLFRICGMTVRALSPRASRRAELPVIMLGAWTWALTWGVWFHAVRPEVYALQGLLSLLALERLVKLQLAARCDARDLYVASFAVALGLTNNYVMSGFLMPALLGCALRVQRQRGVRVLLVCTLLGLLGLFVYAYLPLRAGTQPPANLGDPSSWSRLYWVVSGQLYKSAAGKGLVPLDQSFVELSGILLDQFYGVLLFFSVVGAHAGLRRGGASARVAGLLLAVALTVCVGKPLLGFLAYNPDSIAYLTAGVGALAALSSLGIAVCVTLFERPAASGGGKAVLGLWMAPCVLLWLAITRVLPSADLSSFHAVEGFDEQRLRRLPSRSVVVATTPQTVFRYLELLASERLRPDVVFVPLPFLNYPGFAAALLHQHPELGELVHDFQAAGRVQEAPLAGLAGRRAVLLELDPHIDSALYASLVPRGLFYHYTGIRAATALGPLVAPGQRELYARIARNLGPWLREAETSRQWLYLRFFEALYHAHNGRRGLALEAVSSAQTLFPREPELERLRRALRAPDANPRLDISSFLRFADTKW